MKKIKIGIVGCGAIGSSLSLMVKERFNETFQIVALCDINKAKAEGLKEKLKNCKVVSLEELIRLSDLIVEAASSKVSFDVARRSLLQKKDVLIMSIGGILGKEKKLFDIARRKKRKILFPSGAICGLDGLKAMALAGIEEITLKTFKPPAALEGADYLLKNKINLSEIREEKVIFSGTAKEAVMAFPQNINVVALLSIAAKGEVSPKVKIFVSPGLKRNVHVVEIKSAAGRLEIRCENVASPDNPKTSYLAILSAVSTIAGISDVVRIG